VADYDYVGDDARFFEALRSIVYAARDEPVAIQLRAKSALPGELRALAARARQAVPHGVPRLLNGSGALAWELGYDGVHWPEADIPGDAASANGAPPLRSASVHNLEALARAEAAGADFVVFGSVFEPNSKP